MKFFRVFALVTALASFAWAADIAEDAAFPPDPDMPESEGMNEPPPDAPADVVLEEAPAATTEVTPLEPEEASTVITPVDTGEAETSVVEAVPPSETPLEASETPAGSAHRVVRGDTLWDLAGAYLHDPFQWPKIWEANRGQIANPDLIFPEQEFMIPGVSAAAALEAASERGASPGGPVEETAAGPAPWEEKTEESPVVEPETSAKGEPAEEESEVVENLDEAERDALDAMKRKAGAVRGAGFLGGTADTFVADKDWEYDGYVIRDRDQKMMISQGDVVYLNVGASAGVTPKMTAYIYRVGQKVKDPYLKRQTGRLVKRVGSVIVTSAVSEKGCTAVVITSLEPIRIGDIVKFTTAR